MGEVELSEKGYGTFKNIPTVSIVKGKNPKAMVSKAIELLGGIDRFVKSGDVVFIKPNVCGGVPGKIGSYTNPEIISALIELFKARASRVIVGEADSCMYDADRMLDETGIRKAAEDFGAEVVNLSRGEMVTIDVPDAYVMREIEISKAIADADVIISVPVAKTHINTDVTFSLKCMFGAYPLKNKATYHAWDRLNEVIADIVLAFPPRLSIIDATTGMEGLGPFRGVPINLGMIVCGDNAVATDAVAAHMLGFKPSKIKHIRLATEKGIGPIDMQSIETKGEAIEKIKFKKVPFSAKPFLKYPNDILNKVFPVNDHKINLNYTLFHGYYEKCVGSWRKKGK